MTRSEKALLSLGFWTGAVIGWSVGFGQGFDQGQLAGAHRVFQSMAAGVRTAVGS